MEKTEPTSPFYRLKEGQCTCTGGGVIVPPRIGGVQWPTTVESTLCRTGEWGVGRGGRLGSRLSSCGDHAGVLAAPVGGMVAPVEGTVPCA